MVEGIIYKYTSPSGKSYIGQTINEDLRRKNWFSSKYHYAGSKIDRARAKYGKYNFVYQVLVRNQYSDKSIAIADLNRLEIYYIGLYNTYRNGYNCTIGGDGVVGMAMPEEARKVLSQKLTGRKLSKTHKKNIGIGSRAWQNTPQGKAKMSLAKSGIPRPNSVKAMSLAKQRPVIQMDRDGNYIREFNSIKEASLMLTGKPKSNIVAVCQGKRETAIGYKWKYK